MTGIAILLGFFLTAIVAALWMEIGARSRAWQRIAEERRWDWERRIGSTKSRNKR
jgi:hypothetical protein